MKKKTPKRNSKTIKSKTAKSKTKSAVKTKPKSAIAKRTATAKPTNTKKKLSVGELFALKKAAEARKAQTSENWKHTKDLPPQEQGLNPQATATTTGPKKTGFGGTRHH